MKKSEPFLIDLSGAASGDRTPERLRDEYRFLANHVRHGVWRLDAYGRIVEVNRYLANWLGASPESLIGRRASEFIVVDGGRRAPKLMRTGRFDLDFRSIDGVLRQGEIESLELKTEAGTLIGVLQTVADRRDEAEIETRLVQEVQRMARLAGEDELTGLPNRRSFDLRLRDAVVRAGDQPFGIAVIDIDSFKSINDTLGHAAGDAALVAIAERIRQFVRDSDLVARTGGDEFVVLLQGVSESEGQDAVRRLILGLEFVADLGGEPYPLVASVGFAHSSRHLEDIMLRADRAMYAHKRRRARAPGLESA